MSSMLQKLKLEFNPFEPSAAGPPLKGWVDATENHSGSDLSTTERASNRDVAQKQS